MPSNDNSLVGRAHLCFPPSGVATSTCAQLPQPGLEAGAGRGRDRATAQDLRSQTHLRNLRAPCRHLDLRPLPLHGREPDHDRPPLRPPRPRRTRARNPATRRAQRGIGAVDAGGRWWTLGGRRKTKRPSELTTESAPEQAEERSPLTDSNRRPPLYEEGPCVKSLVVGIAQSGRALLWWVASRAPLSIASSREDQADWSSLRWRSSLGTVRRPGGRWRLWERRVGRG